jgi:hypothetical protein
MYRTSWLVDLLPTSSRDAAKPHRGRRPRAARPRLDRLEDRTVPSAAFWGGFGGNAQHTAVSPVQSQSLGGIRWQSKVDLNPQYSGNDLLIHYGEPAVTQQNTIIIPVKTGATDGFRIEARDGNTGRLRWTESTDYTLAGMTYNWTPSYGPVMTPQGRVYFAGAGGTVYYIDDPDSPTAPVEHRLAFYGLANYAANPAAFNSSVFIDTPITSDASGNIFFGFRVQGAAPAPLSTTQSGWARIGADGTGNYVLVGAMTGDPNITRDSHNVAPALSNDGQTVYVVAKGPTAFYAYLVGLDSTTLATKYQVFLDDPRPGSNPAGELDDGTASPLVGPDGDVYLGVFPKVDNGSRGFMLHFDSTLTVEHAPGAFGWDDTASIVPASMVPSYTGPSSYLLFTKYNNYAKTPGFTGAGDGYNLIAVLDPNATQLDTRNDGATMQVMKEVLTIAGPTPDPEFIDRYPNARREWCINTAVVDPASKSVFANSEDGKLYRWDLTTNSFTQVVTLTPGVGEAYTPTWMGPDGTVYAINNATLFAVGRSNKLMAASSPAVPVRGTLRAGAVAPLLSEAIHRWHAAGADTSGLAGVGVQIGQLGGRTLGVASGHTIWLDDNAAGWGWFVDRTPRGDSEFSLRGDQGERNRMDLLTVLEHEVGHLLGYEHQQGDLMAQTLTAGTRRTPGSIFAQDQPATVGARPSFSPALGQPTDVVFALLASDESGPFKKKG